MLRLNHARRAFEDLRPYLWPLVVLLMVSLLAVPMTLIFPLPIKLLVDSVLGSQPLPGYLTIFVGSQVSKTLALWLAISILMATAVLTYLQNLVSVWYSNKVGNRMTLDVRARLFRQMQRLSVAYHDSMGAADSAYRTLNDAPMLRSFGIDSLIPLTTSILTLGAMILVMVFLDWELALIALLVGVLTAAGLAAVLYIGIGHVPGILTLGSLLVVNYYVTQLYGPLRNVGQSILDIQMSLTGVERYRAVLDEKPDVPELPNAIPLARARGNIAFRNVSFVYTKDHPVLHDITFELPSGNRLGVVGPTGSGKTTLSTLLLRLFDPTEGVITLDDLDLKDYKLADLRNQFAVVHQETVLFSTSVAENIRFAKPNATMDEVIAAATAAKAQDFITNLPNGYDTLVGERGMKLSGGERQRISLARAFLKDAPILILDEPTSSLDVHTESAILATIQELMKGRTTMMIAHRPTTLRDCNMILVLEDGRVSRMTSEVDSVISDMQTVSVQT